jgi:hypothetical protein
MTETRSKSKAVAKKVKKAPKDVPEVRFDPVFSKQIPRKMGDLKFYVTRFQGDYTREQIKKFAQQKSDQLAKLSPNSQHFSVAIAYGEVYRSGKTTAPSEDVSIWDVSDSDVEPKGDITGFDIIYSM